MTYNRLTCSPIGTSGKFLLRHMLSHPSKQPTREVAEELELIALAPSDGGTAFTSARLTDTPLPLLPHYLHLLTRRAHSLPPWPELYALCAAAVAAMPREVAALREGHTNVLNKLVGHVMRASRGRAECTCCAGYIGGNSPPSK